MGVFAMMAALVAASPGAGVEPDEGGAHLAAPTDLVDVASLDPRWVIDIRYATADNFTGKVLYPVGRCVLRRAVADMLLAAQRYLDEHHPGDVLMLKDCYRPWRVQKAMWEVVKGTPQQAYVANPYGKTGSVHNYGCAVDLTLSRAGAEVDMGTPNDHLGRLAQPRHEEAYLRDGTLTAAAVRDRRILRSAMREGGGFKMINNEWWHFDAWQGAALRQRFERLDVPLEDLGGVPVTKTE